MSKKRFLLSYSDRPMVREMPSTEPPARLSSEEFDTIDQALDWAESKLDDTSVHKPMIQDTEAGVTFDWYKVTDMIKRRKQTPTL